MDTARTPDLAMLLLLPDAMRLHLWRPIGDLLSDLQARVQCVLPVALTPAVHAIVYREALATEAGAGALSKQTLLPALFTLDMGIAVILRREGGGLLAALGAMKGSADPAVRRAGSLRALSPLTERGLSLVHVPDSPGEMVRQARALLPGVDLARLAQQDMQGPADPVDIGRLRGFVAMSAEVARCDLPLRMIERAILALLWDPRFSPDPALRALAAAMARPLDGAGARAARFDLASRSLDAVRSPVLGHCIMDSAERQQLRERHGDLLGVARKLSRPGALTLSDGPDLADLIAKHGLFVDPWERHSLSVFCAFPTTEA